MGWQIVLPHQCQEALYVKSRCLARLGRYEEADAVNVMMGDVFDMSTPDCKVLYMIAMLNELHIGDNGLNLMQELIKTKPNSDITEEEFAHKQATAREKAPKAAEYLLRLIKGKHSQQNR